MVEVDEALLVAEARDLVARVQVETAEEKIVPHDRELCRARQKPFTPVEMTNSLKDTRKQQTRF